MMRRTADGLGTQLRRLLELLDGELEQIYRQDHPFYTPRFTPVMKALAADEPLSIKAIAERSS
ncbi:MAG: MarR family transcriptional regulator, partial [Pseudomonadota bacterium]